MSPLKRKISFPSRGDEMVRLQCASCSKPFRTPSGLAWHTDRAHQPFYESRDEDNDGAVHEGEAGIEALQIRLETLEQGMDAFGDLSEKLNSLSDLRDQVVGLEQLVRDLHEAIKQVQQQQAARAKALEYQLAEIQELGSKGAKAQTNVIAVANYLKEELLPALAEHSHGQMVMIYPDQETIDRLPKCGFCGKPKDHGRRACGEFECLAKVLKVSQATPDLKQRRQDLLAGNDQGAHRTGGSLMDLVASS